MAITSFDYIVVGAGSSGAVIATRLSEDPGSKVLLLEAGSANRGPWSSLPLGFGKMVTNPRYVWAYGSEPEPALGDRRVPLLHGKIAGGSSALNGMVYVRGFPQDYARWRQLGAEGWSYDDVLPYFRKAERYARGADAYHGGDGPVGVEGPRWRNPLADAFISSAVSIGLPRIDDFAGSKIEGVAYHDLTTWRGKRSSTWHSYLAPNRRRANLCILTDALVQKITFEGRRATGVVYEREGRLITARAGCEVILSAGALHSPRLLQLSGIGPGTLLSSHGITVVQDLPGVGENLMDHHHVTRGYRTPSRFTLNAVMSGRLAMLAAGANYYLFRRGPLTVGAALAGAFAKTRPELEIPDIQIAFSPVLPDPTTPGGLAAGSGFLLATYQLQPDSRGHVRLRSADPHAEASVVLNTLSCDIDRGVVLRGLKLLRRIAEGEPLQRLGAREVTPGVGEEDDDELLMAHAARTGGSAYHYSGTARMGTDDLAVVDPALRVRGVEGLRVIDASVMPTVTSGNTNAAAIMIGEKGADLVRMGARG